jgi:hypothetical protein
MTGAGRGPVEVARSSRAMTERGAGCGPVEVDRSGRAMTGVARAGRGGPVGPGRDGDGRGPVGPGRDGAGRWLVEVARSSRAMTGVGAGHDGAGGRQKAGVTSQTSFA